MHHVEMHQESASEPAVEHFCTACSYMSKTECMKVCLPVLVHPQQWFSRMLLLTSLAFCYGIVYSHVPAQVPVSFHAHHTVVVVVPLLWHLLAYVWLRICMLRP